MEKMKTHLTIEDVYDMAYDSLDVSNIKVDKEHELAQILDLEWDEQAEAYRNPNCCQLCNGSGYDKRKVCMDCDGSGEIKTKK